MASLGEAIPLFIYVIISYIMLCRGRTKKKTKGMELHNV